jgi:TniQ
MVDPSMLATARPLTRSLDPLVGESLGGYLLRLSNRLRLAPSQLAHLTGCVGQTATWIGRRLLLDLDIDAFARQTRLTSEETAALTFIPWVDRYPPIARSKPGIGRSGVTDDWLFNDIPRYCPHCLAGDGSPIQERYGGPWKVTWHLPISFACTEHHVFLQQGCPRSHPSEPVAIRLITQAADGTLHPAQCRCLRADYLTRRGRQGVSCGARLDQYDDPASPPPSANALETQHQVLDLFSSACPIEVASRFFSDLRVATAMVCASWPLGQDLVEPSMVDAVTEHIRVLGKGTRGSLDRPPTNAVATAGLLTAATSLLSTADLPDALAQHLRAHWTGQPSRAPWAWVFARNEASCSADFQQAARSVTRTTRHSRLHGTRAPSRVGGYLPEHIPAFLEQHWYQQHLAPLQCGHHSKLLRRFGAVLLVQWTAGGSMGDAAAFLGIKLRGRHYWPSREVNEWLHDRGPARFAAALHDLAQYLDTAPNPINYRRRRTALQGWSLSPDTWHSIIINLPPVSRGIKPVLDDRKRQEASAFVWARVTQGEPLFAPRPIEAEQSEDVRLVWIRRRSSTWAKLMQPSPVGHYSALRTLLTQYADQLAKQIDSGSDHDRRYR